ncbi:hypothetical protein BpHYR1_054258 [Brachionus plicatilis]|uniref:Uncharacterized protein n=1 Tax=Brachionus plicatilis TaxID=10195 RepID=A0A3M7T2F3_BRAPC|nr:hypothetical protein BpHYR1_054258 [Brachionus plicatilis]
MIKSGNRLLDDRTRLDTFRHLKSPVKSNYTLNKNDNLPVFGTILRKETCALFNPLYLLGLGTDVLSGMLSEKIMARTIMLNTHTHEKA